MCGLAAEAVEEAAAEEEEAAAVEAAEACRA